MFTETHTVSDVSQGDSCCSGSYLRSEKKVPKNNNKKDKHLVRGRYNGR